MRQNLSQIPNTIWEFGRDITDSSVKEQKYFGLAYNEVIINPTQTQIIPNVNKGNVIKIRLNILSFHFSA